MAQDIKKFMCKSCKKETSCCVFGVCRRCKITMCSKCAKKDYCLRCEKKKAKK
jgi:hypothetical protein